MKIELKKFGTTLTSRQLGREAYSAFTPQLRDLIGEEKIEVYFDGVETFSPSWGDEFLTPLFSKYGNKLILVNTDNPSVKATLETLRKNQ
ncbi:MAG: hypothetical protein AAB507_00010 [Patescibacteria group bacterium]